VKGEYKRQDDNSTDVTYSVGLTRFTRILFIVFSSFVFIGINVFLIANRNIFDRSLLSILLALNGFWVMGNVFGLIVNWVTKKIVDQRFREEFEIGVEDE